jgi:hypothetical protein
MYRRFSHDIEVLADAALENPYIDADFEQPSEPTSTADGAFRVALGTEGQVAFAKPAKNIEKAKITCAHEKIVSDLANCLRLSVPPVHLLRCQKGPPYPELLAISYIPFPEPRTFEKRSGGR